MNFANLYLLCLLELMFGKDVSFSSSLISQAKKMFLEVPGISGTSDSEDPRDRLVFAILNLFPDVSYILGLSNTDQKTGSNERIILPQLLLQGLAHLNLNSKSKLSTLSRYDFLDKGSTTSSASSSDSRYRDGYKCNNMQSALRKAMTHPFFLKLMKVASAAQDQFLKCFILNIRTNLGEDRIGNEQSDYDTLLAQEYEATYPLAVPFLLKDYKREFLLERPPEISLLSSVK